MTKHNPGWRKEAYRHGMAGRGIKTMMKGWESTPSTEKAAKKMFKAWGLENASEREVYDHLETFNLTALEGVWRRMEIGPISDRPKTKDQLIDDIMAFKFGDDWQKKAFQACGKPTPGGMSFKAHKKPADFNQEQLKKGTKVEFEHTNDKIQARKIAMDHLTEFPDYYKELAVMEKKLEKQKKGKYISPNRPTPAEEGERAGRQENYERERQKEKQKE